MSRYQKYYQERPIAEVYKGWNIRKYSWECPYFGAMTDYVCDVRVGVESIQSSSIEDVHEWIDKKIAEGKVQHEEI